ncbi:T-cell immunoglobulin and mucin domain-containing protein 4-like isoform X18 [Tachysurus ichikawai]
MNQLHCCIFSLVLLSFTVSTCSAMTVYGVEGQDINLPCKYDSVYHGVCDVCWMIGNIPNNGCGTQIIYANEKEVLMRVSARYQLNGDLKMGDASLTIRNARISDSGKYGCRVHVPGWFNDKKIVVNLAIRKGPVLTTQNDIATTSEPATTMNTGPVSTTNDTTTTSPDNVTTEHTALVTTVVNSENYPDESSMENNMPVKEVTVLPAILVPGILILLFMGIVALYLISKHRRRFRSTLGIGKNSSTSVIYNNLENVILPMASSSDNEMS